MIFTTLRHYALCGALLLTTACGANYATQYDYTAPASPEGKQCASSCLQQQQACKGVCNQRAAACKSISQIKDGLKSYGLHEYSSGRAANYPSYMGMMDIDLPDCQNIRECPENCDETYRSCFTICGGQVTARQVCMSNCT